MAEPVRNEAEFPGIIPSDLPTRTQGGFLIIGAPLGWCSKCGGEIRDDQISHPCWPGYETPDKYWGRD